jgi:pimeloyl-ACP methyl ester carboxylesterase
VWANTLALIARQTQAWAFDRAGSAWSDPAPPDVPRTSRQIVAEMRLALDQAGVHPPYILLGHSFGGIHMLVWAYTHPQEVAGLVLVDSSHPEMFERSPGVGSPKLIERSQGVMAALARTGLFRLLGKKIIRMLLPNCEGALPPQVWAALVAFAGEPKTYAAAQREARYGLENCAAARGEPGSLGDLPIEILTADWWVTGKKTALKSNVIEMREEMVGLSTRARHVIVSGCEHSTLPVLRADAVAESVAHILAIHSNPKG